MSGPALQVQTSESTTTKKEKEDRQKTVTNSSWISLK